MPHTRTPWKLDPPEGADDPCLPLVVGGKHGCEPICEICGPLADEDGPHRGAYDLALILAAPSLLAACRALLDGYRLENGQPVMPLWQAREILQNVIVQATTPVGGGPETF